MGTSMISMDLRIWILVLVKELMREKPMNIQALEQYVKAVQNTKDFQCGLCEYTSNRPAKVKNHLEAIHFPGIFVYSCDICEKTFSGRNAFGVHKSQVHSKKKSSQVFQESI